MSRRLLFLLTLLFTPLSYAKVKFGVGLGYGTHSFDAFNQYKVLSQNTPPVEVTVDEKLWMDYQQTPSVRLEFRDLEKKKPGVLIFMNAYLPAKLRRQRYSYGGIIYAADGTDQDSKIQTNDLTLALARRLDVFYTYWGFNFVNVNLISEGIEPSLKLNAGVGIALGMGWHIGEKFAIDLSYTRNFSRITPTIGNVLIPEVDSIYMRLNLSLIKYF